MNATVKREELANRDDSRSLASVFSALGNEERLVILSVLARDRALNRSGASISVIARRVGVSRFSASRHLRILEVAGLITAHRVGHSILHRLTRGGLDQVEDWLYGHSPELFGS